MNRMLILAISSQCGKYSNADIFPHLQTIQRFDLANICIQSKYELNGPGKIDHDGLQNSGTKTALTRGTFRTLSNNYDATSFEKRANKFQPITFICEKYSYGCLTGD